MGEEVPTGLRRLDLTLPDLHANLALDEALLLQAEGGGPEILRFWEWKTPAVVLGAGGIVADDVRLEACRTEGIPLARRGSGGGTVLLGRGCLCFSLVLRYDRASALREVRPSYGWILGKVIAALEFLVSGIRVEGSSDLVRGERKFSGNAQQRKRHHLLHHGTLLLDFDLTLLPRYLKLPPRRPEYRQDRDHLDFVGNLAADAAQVMETLTETWGAVVPLQDIPLKEMRRLVEEKYGKQDWVERR